MSIALPFRCSLLRAASPLIWAAIAVATIIVSGLGASAQVELSPPIGASRPAAGGAGGTSAAGASQWVKGYNSAVRLVAGAELTGDGGRRLVAGVEIRLAEDWKTYWRHPGDDGGLPPTFDWTGSRNVKSQRVLYPAPGRSRSLNGITIGYEKAVTFPVLVEPVDPTKPVMLALTFEYGICREICVPAEAKLALTIPAALATMPPELAASLRRVPRLVEGASAGRVLKSAIATLSGASPTITFDVAALEDGASDMAAGRPGGDVDLFVEPPAGVDLPVPVRVGDVAGGAVRFRIDLKGLDKPAVLAGQPLRLTVTSSNGNAELVWRVE